MAQKEEAPSCLFFHLLYSSNRTCQTDKCCIEVPLCQSICGVGFICAYPASDITTSSAYSIHDTFTDYLDAAKAQVFFFFRDGFRGLTDCGVGPGRILPAPGKILHSLDVGSTSSWRNSTGEKQRYERCGTAIRTSTPLRGPLHHLACLQLPLSPVRNVVLGLENKQQP